MTPETRSKPAAQPSPARLITHGVYRGALVAIFLLAFILRVAGLGASDLVLDEGVSFFIATKSAPDIVRYCLSALWEHPPGYYLLLHAWMRLVGTSEFALRFLSVLGGMLGVALAVTLTRRWFGRNIGLLAGLLFALSPMALDYTRNARMYAILMALSLLAAYLFDRALTSGRGRDWLPFVAVLLAGMAMHYLIAFVMLAYGLFLLVRWRHLGRGKVWFTVMLALAAAAGVAILLAFPGPRTSVMDLVRNRLEGMNSILALEPVYTHWPLGLTGEILPRLASFPLAAFVWVLGILGIAWMPVPARWPRRDLQWLLALLILVPPLAQWFLFPGQVLFPGLSARHTSATFGFFMIGVTLSIAGAWQRRRPLGILLGALTITLFSAISVRQMLNDDRLFSPPWTYANDRARDGELFVYTYFFDWPQNTYYNRRDLPSRAIPGGPEPFGDESLDVWVTDVVRNNASWWLSIYEGRVETERVEKAFNAKAFSAERTWLPGRRGISHYYAPAEMVEGQAGLTWDEGIRLDRYWSSDATLEAGDALRLVFEWQAPEGVAGQAVSELKLVGPDGRTWSRRLGQPCNDRCPTHQWGREPVADRMAFEIAPDIPPGQYELRLGWVGVDGRPWLGRAAGGSVSQVDLPLMQVTVTPQTGGLARRSAAPLPRPIGRKMGDALTLRSAEWQDGSAQAGSEITVPLQWTVAEAPGEMQVHLILRQNGRELHRVTRPLGADWYGSGVWAAGEIVRTQPSFTIPATAAAGDYELATGVSRAGDDALLGEAAIGALTVLDRPREFTVPDTGSPVDARWAEGIRLVRAAAPAAAAPGGTMGATLVWQAGGPASHNWKVFFHLADEQGEVRSQADGFPQAGGAPASGWRTGEVVVDEHLFNLPADLAPGTYRLRVGFYDEQTFERLALEGGGDTFVLPITVEVAP